MLVGNVHIEGGEASTPLPFELALEQAGNVLGGDPKRNPFPVVPEPQVRVGPGEALAALLAVLVMTEQCQWWGFWSTYIGRVKLPECRDPDGGGRGRDDRGEHGLDLGSRESWRTGGGDGFGRDGLGGSSRGRARGDDNDLNRDSRGGIILGASHRAHRDSRDNGGAGNRGSRDADSRSEASRVGNDWSGENRGGDGQGGSHQGLGGRGGSSRALLALPVSLVLFRGTGIRTEVVGERLGKGGLLAREHLGPRLHAGGVHFVLLLFLGSLFRLWNDGLDRQAVSRRRLASSRHLEDRLVV